MAPGMRCVGRSIVWPSLLDTNCGDVPMREGENEFGEPFSNLWSQEASKNFNKGVIHLGLWLWASLLARRHQREGCGAGKVEQQGREQPGCAVAREQLRARPCSLSLTTEWVLQVLT